MEKKDKESGFTLIELLVVIIIIGILAAIAIPAFLSQKNKAKDASAKSDASVIGKQLAAYYVDGLLATTVTGSGGTYTITDSASATVDSGKLSKGNTVTSTSKGTTAGAYCVAVLSGGGATWQFNSATGGLSSGNCP
jgi:type IV pilus assembly protein PilA